MTSFDRTKFLRQVLTADAAISTISAVMFIAGAATLHEYLGLPATLLRWAGISLIPFCAFLMYLLRQETIPRPAAWFVVGCNALWAADSILLLLSDWVAPTLAGQVFVVFQALVVAAFAEAQYVGLRRSAPAAAAG